MKPEIDDNNIIHPPGVDDLDDKRPLLEWEVRHCFSGYVGQIVHARSEDEAWDIANANDPYTLIYKEPPNIVDPDFVGSLERWDEADEIECLDGDPEYYAEEDWGAE